MSVHGETSLPLNRKPIVSVAPMMDWTDRHCRYFHRLLAPSAVLYTEMVTAAALAHGDTARLLQFDASEHPVVLQVGGNDPGLMADAARAGFEAGFDAININVGCPSDRVQSGAFGACLMKTPAVVADCFAAMSAAVPIPVTVKSRIGVDEADSDAFLDTFVRTLADAGCTHFDIHARIAILKGLSPKENRTVPPLNYPRVYALKQRYPELVVVINGGVQTLDDAAAHLRQVDGIMIGREAYQNPFSLTEMETAFGTRRTPVTREQVVTSMQHYATAQLERGDVQLKHIVRHMLGLFNGLPGARQWRRTLSERSHQKGVDVSLFDEALDARLSAARHVA
ncbi:MAG: tRNA dihydrouridine(20/20a) synthase DusA [Pseudomonadota bacterium]